MQGKLNTLGIVWQIWGALALLAGIGIFGWLALAGRAAGGTENPGAGLGFGLAAGAVALVICGLFGIVEIAAGGAIKKNKSWARTALIVLGILNLFSFPFGTIVGIYTLVVLLSGDAKAVAWA